MAVSPTPAKRTAKSTAKPATQATRSEADKLGGCFAQAMRLTASLKRAKLTDLSDEVFMIAAQLKSLEKAAKGAQK